MSEQGKVENVSAFFNKLEPLGYTLRRVNTNQGRYYVVDDRMFISVTSLIDMTTKTDEGLVRKMCDTGYNEWMRFLNERATYGTIMHILIADFLNDTFINFGIIDNRIEELFEEHRVEERKRFHFMDDLRKDLLAFAEFAAEYQIVPLCAELPMVSFKYGFAGTLDLICLMDIKEKGFFGEVYKSGANKGAPKETYSVKRVMGIIDFKSGRNGFTDKHADQLTLCRMLVDENYPNLLEDYDVAELHTFNWAPKDWRTEPTYTLKNQTGATPDSVALAKILIAKEKVKDTIPTFLKTSGMVELGQRPTENYQFKRVI